MPRDLNITGVHRRPELYPDPERFDPERFSPEREAQLPKQAFMPFNGGLRVCIGNHFAMMEAQLVLASWVHKLRFQLAQSEPPDFEPLLTLRPRGGIRMSVTHRDQRSHDVGNSGSRALQTVMKI